MKLKLKATSLFIIHMQQQQREAGQLQDDDNDLYTQSAHNNNINSADPVSSSSQSVNAHRPAYNIYEGMDGEVADAFEETQESQGFQIIGKDSDNQALLIKLHTDNLLWHRGTILCSSYRPQDRVDANDFARNLMETVGFADSSPKMLLNSTKSMQYYILSKQEPLNGKILTLFQKTYRENFFVNMKHLLTINYDHTEYSVKSHPELRSLKQITPHNSHTLSLEQYRVSVPAKKTPLPLFITMQSTKDTPIVEKLLGHGESMYLPNAEVLALGENVRVKWDSKARLMKFTGPGYVFFEPRSKMRRILSVRYREMMLANFVLIIFIVSLYLIEAYFFK